MCELQCVIWEATLGGVGLTACARLFYRMFRRNACILTVFRQGRLGRGKQISVDVASVEPFPEMILETRGLAPSGLKQMAYSPAKPARVLDRK